MEQNKYPLVTVVTVVKNGEEEIERTINSVYNQKYPNIEYIVIDGLSTDKTLEIIQKNQHKIDKWISSKDLGIYDAMNRGVEMANGVWINFMNCGDELVEDIINKIFSNISNQNADILYGSVLIKYKSFSVIKKAKSIKHLWSGMKFCHQSSFCRVEDLKMTPFNISNKICADFEFFYTMKLLKKKFVNINETVSVYLNSGISDLNRIDNYYYSINTIKLLKRNRIFSCYYYLRIYLEKMKIYIKRKIGINKTLYLIKIINILNIK